MFKNRKLKKETIKKFAVYESRIKRLAELKRELDKIDTRNFRKEEKSIRKKLKDVYRIPEVEEELRRLKIKAAGLEPDFFASKIDKRQNTRLRELAREAKIMGESTLPALKSEIKTLKSEIEQAEKLAGRKEITYAEKADIHQIPVIKKSLEGLNKHLKNEQKKLEAEITKKSSYGRSKISRNFKQAEAWDTDQEQKINMLIEEIDKLNTIVPNLIGRALKAERSSKKLLKKVISRNEVLEDAVPNLQEKSSFFDRLFKKEQSEISFLKQEISEAKSEQEKLKKKSLPSFQRKTGFLGKAIRENESELSNLENRYNRHRLEFEERLAKELAEYKRMVEDSKYAMKQQMMQALAETIKGLTEEKAESEKKLIEEIKRLESKIDSEKKQMNDNFSKKIVQLKDRFEDDVGAPKFESANDNLGEPAKQPMVQMPQFKVKKPQVKKERELTDEDLGFKPLPDLPMQRIKVNISQPVIYEPPIRPVPKPVRMENLDLPPPVKYFNFEEKFPEKKIAEKQKIIAKPKPAQSSLPEVPKAAFIDSADFHSLVQNLNGFSDVATGVHQELLKQAREKDQADNELERCFINLERIRLDLEKINSGFFRSY